MAKKRTLNDAEQEIAALRAQLAAAGQGDGEAAPAQRFPTVLYRRAKTTEKNPNGYEPRRVGVRDGDGKLDEAACEAEVGRLEKAGWVHSPADLA